MHPSGYATGVFNTVQPWLSEPQLSRLSPLAKHYRIAGIAIGHVNKNSA